MLVLSERRNDATMDDFPTPRCPVSITVYHSPRPAPFSSFRLPLNASALPFPVWSRGRKWGSSFELDESSSVWSIPSVQGSSRCLILVKLRTCGKNRVVPLINRTYRFILRPEENSCRRYMAESGVVGESNNCSNTICNIRLTVNHNQRPIISHMHASFWLGIDRRVCSNQRSYMPKIH